MAEAVISNDLEILGEPDLVSRLVDAWYGRDDSDAVFEFFEVLPDEESNNVLNAAAARIEGHERVDFIESIFESAQAESYRFHVQEPEPGEPNVVYGYADMFVIPCVVRGNAGDAIDDMEFTASVEDALVASGFLSPNSSVMVLPYFLDARDAALMSPHDVRNILASLSSYALLDEDEHSLGAFELIEKFTGAAAMSGVRTNVYGSAKLLVGVRAIQTEAPEAPDDLIARCHRPHVFGDCKETERMSDRSGLLFCAAMVEEMDRLGYLVAFDTPKTWNIGLGMSAVTDLYARFADEAAQRHIDLSGITADLHIGEIEGKNEFYVAIANPNVYLGPISVPISLIESGVPMLKFIFEDILGFGRIYHPSMESFPRLHKSHCN